MTNDEWQSTNAQIGAVLCRQLPVTGVWALPSGSRRLATANCKLSTANRSPGEAALREAMRKWRRRENRKVDGVDVTPACLHGVIVQDGLDEVRGDLEDIKAELQWIRKLIVAAIVTAGIGTLLRMAGLQ